MSASVIMMMNLRVTSKREFLQQANINQLLKDTA